MTDTTTRQARLTDEQLDILVNDCLNITEGRKNPFGKDSHVWSDMRDVVDLVLARNAAPAPILTAEQIASINSPFNACCNREACRSMLAAPAPGQVQSDALYQAVFDCLINHGLSYTEDPGSGEKYPLVDKLSAPGDETIRSDKDEIQILAEAIVDAIDAMVAAPAAPAPKE